MVTDYFILAVLSAVKAKHAFAYSYIAGRRTASLAELLAQFAVDTFALILADSPEGKSTKDTEERSQRTDESAVEAWDEDVKKERCEKYRQYQPCPFVEPSRY